MRGPWLSELELRRTLWGNHVEIRDYLHVTNDKIRVVQPEKRTRARWHRPTVVDRNKDAAGPQTLHIDANAWHAW